MQQEPPVVAALVFVRRVRERTLSNPNETPASWVVQRLASKLPLPSVTLFWESANLPPAWMRNREAAARWRQALEGNGQRNGSETGGKGNIFIYPGLGIFMRRADGPFPLAGGGFWGRQKRAKKN